MHGTTKLSFSIQGLGLRAWDVASAFVLVDPSVQAASKKVIALRFHGTHIEKLMLHSAVVATFGPAVTVAA